MGIVKNIKSALQRKFGKAAAVAGIGLAGTGCSVTFGTDAHYPTYVETVEVQRAPAVVVQDVSWCLDPYTGYRVGCSPHHHVINNQFYLGPAPRHLHIAYADIGLYPLSPLFNRHGHLYNQPRHILPRKLSPVFRANNNGGPYIQPVPAQRRRATPPPPPPRRRAVPAPVQQRRDAVVPQRRRATPATGGGNGTQRRRATPYNGQKQRR